MWYSSIDGDNADGPGSGSETETDSLDLFEWHVPDHHRMRHILENETLATPPESSSEHAFMPLSAKVRTLLPVVGHDTLKNTISRVYICNTRS